MSYADSLLAKDERVLRRARQHPLVIFDDAFGFIGVVVLGIILLIGGGLVSGAVNNPAIPITPIAFGLAMILWVVALIRFLIHWLTWRSEEYLVTSRRVIKCQGLIQKRSADSALEQINDAVLNQSILGRWLDYGDLEILTAAAEAGIDNFRTLRAPIAFKQAMMDAKMGYERDIRGYPARHPQSDQAQDLSSSSDDRSKQPQPDQPAHQTWGGEPEAAQVTPHGGLDEESLRRHRIGGNGPDDHER